VVDVCGSLANQSITVLSYLHIAFQPIFISAFAMAIAPVVVSPRMRRWVFALSGAATALMLLRLVPIDLFGQCRPGTALCGPAFCVISGNWHIGWEIPLNGLSSRIGLSTEFPEYMLAVFVMPLFYGAWRFVVFHALAGPVLAMTLTSNPNEMPAIWCLFSVGLMLIAMSPLIRYRVIKAAAPERA